MPVIPGEFGFLVYPNNGPLTFLRRDAVMEIAGVPMPAVVAGTKNLSGTLRISARVGAPLSFEAFVGGTARCKARLTGDVHNGRSELSAVFASRTTIARAAMQTPGGAFAAPPTVHGPYTYSASLYMAGGQPDVLSTGQAVFFNDYDNGSNLRTVTCTADGTMTLYETIAAAGETIDGQTVTSGGLFWGGVGKLDYIYRTYVFSSTKLFYFAREYGGSFTRDKFITTTAQPPAGSEARVFSPGTDVDTVYVFYNTSFTASGKTYSGTAVVKSTDKGATWGTPARLIANTWASGSGTSNYKMGTLYQVFSDDATKFYMTLFRTGTSAGWILVWIDLSTLTASTTPIRVDLGTNQTEVPWFVSAPTATPSTTLVYIEATKAAPFYLKVEATTANWKTPTITAGTAGALENTSYDAKTLLQLYGSAPTHDITYSLPYITSAYNLKARWRAHTDALYSTDGRTELTLSTAVTTSVASGPGLRSGGGAHYVGRHAVVTNNKFFLVDWTTQPYYAVHINGAARAKTAVSLALVTSNSGVAMAGLMSSNATATVNLLLADSIPLSGNLVSITSVSLSVHIPSLANLGGVMLADATATLNLQANRPVELAGVFVGHATSWLDLRVGKILMEGVSTARTQIALAITVVGQHYLQGAASSRVSSTLASTTTIRLQGQASAVGSAATSISVTRLPSALLASSVRADCAVQRTIDLAGVATCECAARVRVFGWQSIGNQVAYCCVDTGEPIAVAVNEEAICGTT